MSRNPAFISRDISSGSNGYKEERICLCQGRRQACIVVVIFIYRRKLLK